MTTIPASIRERLEKPFQLTSDQIQFYQKNRFIKLKQVFDEETISFFNDVRIERGDKICEVKSIVRCNKYVQNCLIAYTKNHFQFLTYWAGLSQDEEAISVCHEDEEIYNAVLWKYGQTETLGYICVTNGTVDVDGLGRFGSVERSYEKFEAGEFDRDMFTDRNNFYSRFDQEKVMIFHGIK